MGHEPPQRHTDRARFDAFYEAKWGGIAALWMERYPPAQRAYAVSVYQRRNEAVADAIGPDAGAFLDVGCGVGDLLVALAPAASRLSGVDISAVNTAYSIANMERAGVRGLIVQAGAEVLPFTDGSFDSVVLADVIEHVPDVEGALAECRRVLRPGGRVIVVTPIREVIRLLDLFDSALAWLGGARGVSFRRREHPAVFERFLTRRELAAALRRARLRPIRFDRICCYPAPERPGVLGALMARLERRLRPSAFDRCTGFVIRACDALATMRFANQKQLWVARRE